MPILLCDLCLDKYPKCSCGDASNLNVAIETSEIFMHYPDHMVDVPTILECDPYPEIVFLHQLVPIQEWVSSHSLNYFVKKLFDNPKFFWTKGVSTNGEIRVYENHQGIYVVDGHHRIASMMLMGIPQCKVWYSAESNFSKEDRYSAKTATILGE